MMSNFEKVAFLAILDAATNNLLPLANPTDEPIGVYEIPASITDEAGETRQIKFVTTRGVFYATVLRKTASIFDVNLGQYHYIYEV